MVSVSQSEAVSLKCSCKLWLILPLVNDFPLLQQSWEKGFVPALSPSGDLGPVERWEKGRGGILPLCYALGRPRCSPGPALG